MRVDRPGIGTGRACALPHGPPIGGAMSRTIKNRRVSVVAVCPPFLRDANPAPVVCRPGQYARVTVKVKTAAVGVPLMLAHPQFEDEHGPASV